MNVRVGPQRKLSAKELMVSNCGWRRLLRIPWTARRSNQSILKEISPEYSWKRLMLKFQYFDAPDSLEKTLMLGKAEGRRRRGRQRMMVGWHHRLNGHQFEQALGDGEGQGSLVCCSPWGRKESGTTEHHHFLRQCRQQTRN